jgi:hypothetical protein
VKALRLAGCKRVFEEKAPGWPLGLTPTPQRLGTAQRRGRLGCLETRPPFAVFKTPPAFTEQVSDARAGFRSITETVDTTTSASRMVMQMLGSFAEFERSMVRERTRAGLAAARDRGARLGLARQIEPSPATRSDQSSPRRIQNSGGRRAPFWGCIVQILHACWNAPI